MKKYHLCAGLKTKNILWIQKNYVSPFHGIKALDADVFITTSIFQPAIKPTTQNVAKAAMEPATMSAPLSAPLSAALPALQPTTRFFADLTTQLANPTSSISQLMKDWGTEVIQPVSLCAMCQNYKDNQGDIFKCGLCSSTFETLYLFLSHKS